VNIPEVLEHAHTDIGTIYLDRYQISGRADWIYQIQIEGQLLMSSVNNVSERRLATSALASHEGTGPLRVLIGGLGLGYTAHAALANPRVASVRVIEKMGFVIQWMRDGLLPLSQELAAGDRLEIVKGDAYDHMLGPATETYDLILIDVDHAPNDPLSPQSAPFYTVAGQEQVARHLNPGGILGVWSAHDCDEFADVLDTVYPYAKREDVRWADETGVAGPPFHNVLFFARTATR
jgi:spermidine synthase